MRIYLALGLFLIASAPVVASCEDRDGAVREAIGAALKQRVGADAEVIVGALRIFSRTADPCAATCVVTPDPGSLLGQTIRFALQTPAKGTATPRLIRTGSVEASVRVTVPGVRAATIIHRGDVVSDQEVRKASIDLSGVPLRRSLVVADVVGARALRDIAAGEQLTPSMLLVLPVVRTGQHVTGLSRFGGAEVSATLMAAESGVSGDIIRMVNPDSRRPLRARILSSTLVEIVHD